MDLRSEDRLASEAGSTVGAVGDERTTADFDDINVTHRPRRHDDDEDEGSDVDDDAESTTSAQAAGNSKGAGNGEEEKELPPHACA